MGDWEKPDHDQDNFIQQGDFYWREEEPNLLPALATRIEAIKELNQKHPEKKERLDELVRNLLDTIRFLFKSRHYKEEQEVRVVQFHGYEENNTRTLNSRIKVDVEQIPPRFYLEAPENFCFHEVLLGPRTQGSREWISWIKEQNMNVQVRQSKIKYGNPYF